MKQSNALILALVCLVVGFVGGVFYSSYTTPPGMESMAQRPAGMPPQGMPSGEPSPIQTEQQTAVIEAKVKDWQKKVDAAPDQPDIYVQAGNDLFDTEAYAEAIPFYQKAVDLGLKNADVLTDIGVCYRRLGDPKKAVEYFRQARKVDPTHQTSALNLGVVLLHDLGDQKGAVEAWKQYLALNPTGERADAIRQVINRIEGGTGQSQ